MSLRALEKWGNYLQPFVMEQHDGTRLEARRTGKKRDKTSLLSDFYRSLSLSSGIGVKGPCARRAEKGTVCAFVARA